MTHPLTCSLYFSRVLDRCPHTSHRQVLHQLTSSMWAYHQPLYVLGDGFQCGIRCSLIESRRGPRQDFQALDHKGTLSEEHRLAARLLPLLPSFINLLLRFFARHLGRNRTDLMQTSGQPVQQSTLLAKTTSASSGWFTSRGGTRSTHTARIAPPGCRSRRGALCPILTLTVTHVLVMFLCDAEGRGCVGAVR